MAGYLQPPSVTSAMGIARTIPASQYVSDAPFNRITGGKGHS